MVFWHMWCHGVSTPANQGSKGNPAGSVVSPGMALVASKQGDGSVHVLSPLKFKLGVTWFHFMMVMYLYIL